MATVRVGGHITLLFSIHDDALLPRNQGSRGAGLVSNMVLPYRLRKRVEARLSKQVKRWLLGARHSCSEIEGND